MEKELCLQQFADDTNRLLSNDDRSIESFWQCLATFCLASGSQINHGKTGYKASSGSSPPLVVQAGCQQIEECKVFWLLGIPMGFKVSMNQRFEWVLNRFRRKVFLWHNMQSTLPTRVFVLNHSTNQGVCSEPLYSFIIGLLSSLLEAYQIPDEQDFLHS
ncbi:hypothetical protein GOP47_0021152 [Adiantum capillus-veneris]|uniref:Reverse transcriptase domain-containing protein n=1 Tax=Adiantum capillus-veneris TaxID=13818 RepID=A0A9D4UBC9_ADICA|nr:hypothetical protein GOP47_0021152 [Adiantum capillus-veneris]